MRQILSNSVFEGRAALVPLGSGASTLFVIRTEERNFCSSHQKTSPALNRYSRMAATLRAGICAGILKEGLESDINSVYG